MSNHVAGRGDGGDRAQGRARRGHGRWAPAPDEPGTQRLFFAIPVPHPICAAVGDLMASVQASVGEDARIRWVRVEGLHLTLRFLGATPVDHQVALERAADDLAREVPPFTIGLSGGGAFPGPDRPRSLWIGVTEGADRLADLSAGLASAASTLGRPIESRPFAPHLTLARTDGVRQAPAAAARLVEAAADVDLRFEAGHVVLYRSHLGGGPARYEPLHESRLGD